mgnify:FL=1
MAKLYSDYKNILEIENFDDIFEIEKPKIERVYKELQYFKFTIS